ncbi:hypothetical protein [Noviherbaspirillum aerium]|uniref:hypothetical protein n=1 Tax=Noviherbaspirillum aerium TaxID=2588497 RepID=UPI00178C4B21|nr:hypothetical protein [Noviherbaspirillum aerium]
MKGDQFLVLLEKRYDPLAFEALLNPLNPACADRAVLRHWSKQEQKPAFEKNQRIKFV